MVGLCLAGCGPSVAEREARDLAEKVDALRGQVARQDERLADLSNKVVVLSDRLRSAEQAAKAPGVQVPEHLEVVRVGPRMPPGQQLEPPQPVQEPEDEVVLELTGGADGDRLRVVKLAPPPGRVMRGHVTEPRASKPKGEPKRESEVADAKADEEFRAALQAFNDGKPQQAFALFAAFVSARPRHASADSARYWMGECHLEMKSYLGAVEQFTRVATDYPKSKKVAEALLKIGLAYEKLGDHRRARESFESLVNRFPQSAVAELARARVGSGTQRGEGRP